MCMGELNRVLQAKLKSGIWVPIFLLRGFYYN